MSYFKELFYVYFVMFVPYFVIVLTVDLIPIDLLLSGYVSNVGDIFFIFPVLYLLIQSLFIFIKVLYSRDKLEE